MTNPERKKVKNVSLTARERREFHALVGKMNVKARASDGVWTRWNARARQLFWRHRTLALLLIPIGIAMTMLALATWWPLGLVGAAVLCLGMIEATDRARMKLDERRLRRGR